MGATGTAPRRRRRGVARAAAALRAATCLLAAACAGPPPMEPLTEAALQMAERRWEVEGAESYHLVVRVRPPRTDPAVYDVVVAAGHVAAIERNGQRVRPEDAARYDYSVSGLFRLLRTDLHWTEVEPVGDTPAVDLRARFEPDTGRLVRYRRTVGTARRRVLLVEVLSYEPNAT